MTLLLTLQILLTAILVHHSANMVYANTGWGSKLDALCNFLRHTSYGVAVTLALYLIWGFLP